MGYVNNILFANFHSYVVNIPYSVLTLSPGILIFITHQFFNTMAFPRYYLFPPEEQTLSEFFRAMGHPVRKLILMDLKSGKMTVTGMAKRYPLSRETICQHLEILRDTQLVKFREVYPYTFYWRNEKQIALAKTLIESFLFDL